VERGGISVGATLPAAVRAGNRGAYGFMVAPVTSAVNTCVRSAASRASATR